MKNVRYATIPRTSAYAVLSEGMSVPWIRENYSVLSANLSQRGRGSRKRELTENDIKRRKRWLMNIRLI